MNRPAASGQTQHALKLRQHQRTKVMLTEKFASSDQPYKFHRCDKAGREARIRREISGALTRFDKKRMDSIAEPSRASGTCAQQLGRPRM
jgi:hypothetical protein